MSRYSWKRALYAAISWGVEAAPMMISLTTPFLMEMSILMVGEMLAMLPSLNASGVGMGFLNQSIGPNGIKYLVSTTYTGFLLEGMRASCGRKSAR
jgi:hypothetical protein